MSKPRKPRKPTINPLQKKAEEANLINLIDYIDKATQNSHKQRILQHQQNITAIQNFKTRLYDPAIWRSVLQNSGCTIPGVALPPDIEFEVCVSKAERDKLLLFYMQNRQTAIENMDIHTLYAVCSTNSLKCLGHSIPYDFIRVNLARIAADDTNKA